MTLDAILKLVKVGSMIFTELRSMNEAYRAANDLPDPEPLPEEWEKLLAEPDLLQP